MHSNSEQLSQEMENDDGDFDDDDVKQGKFCIGNNPSAILDPNLDREELKELILEEENIFDKKLP